MVGWGAGWGAGRGGASSLRSGVRAPHPMVIGVMSRSSGSRLDDGLHCKNSISVLGEHVLQIRDGQNQSTLLLCALYRPVPMLGLGPTPSRLRLFETARKLIVMMHSLSSAPFAVSEMI